MMFGNFFERMNTNVAITIANGWLLAVFFFSNNQAEEDDGNDVHGLVNYDSTAFGRWKQISYYRSVGRYGERWSLVINAIVNKCQKLSQYGTRKMVNGRRETQ